MQKSGNLGKMADGQWKAVKGLAADVADMQAMIGKAARGRIPVKQEGKSHPFGGVSN